VTLSTVGGLSLTGFVLGWSVAWPPGPINAEAVRRGLARRPWPAYAVVLGGCCGDALWALSVGLGAGALLRVTHVQRALGAAGVVLMLLLAAVFLRGAWRGLAEIRSGRRRNRAATGSGSPRGGFGLGLTLALTSPWNLAFWLAVVGQAQGVARELGASLVMALGVLAGAATWGLVLCAGVARLGAWLATPWWEVVTEAATGALMISFAVGAALRLSGS
jgi:threonine/homoserine/homoserine lactone efflux protein